MYLSGGDNTSEPNLHDFVWRKPGASVQIANVYVECSKKKCETEQRRQKYANVTNDCPFGVVCTSLFGLGVVVDEIFPDS